MGRSGTSHRAFGSHMDWQMRNWYLLHVLSEDHIVEQHVHNMDKAAWAMGINIRCRRYGLGGSELGSNRILTIFDHHAWSSNMRTARSCFCIVGRWIVPRTCRITLWARKAHVI